MTSHPICSIVACPNFDSGAERAAIVCPACRAQAQEQNAQFVGQYQYNQHLDALVGSPIDEEQIWIPQTAEQIAADRDTGAKRCTDSDHLRFDLVPMRMIERVARVMATGAERYGAHNWEKGFKWSSVMNHLLKHAIKWMIGDTSEDHLAHMVCNLGFLIEYETTHPELNDIPSRMKEPDA